MGAAESDARTDAHAALAQAMKRCKIVEWALGTLRFAGVPNFVDIEVAYRSKQTAFVVGVRVRNDHEVEM